MNCVKKLTLILSTAVLIVAGRDRACKRPACIPFTAAYKGPVQVPDSNANGSDQSWTIFCFDGLKQSFSFLWTRSTLDLEFSKDMNNGKKYLVYYGNSVAKVEQMRGDSKGSIAQSLLVSINGLQPKENLPLQAFNLSCVGIDSDRSYTARVKISVVCPWYLAYLLAGVVLFFSAKSWSQNASLHYGTGVSLGVMASFIILLYIMSRFLPQKLKYLGYILLTVGSSASLWLLSFFTGRLPENMTEKMVDYWQYILGYFIVMGLLSFGLVYRYGPVTDRRTLNLIQWLLQGIGLLLVYHSTQIREVSFALIIIILTVYFFPRNIFDFQCIRNIWWRLFPPKVKLLTQEEYEDQAENETRKALEELRSFCKSPDCKTWRVVSQLKNPGRFADFVEGESWHVGDDEMLEYETGPDPDPSALITDDEDERDLWH